MFLEKCKILDNRIVYDNLYLMKVSANEAIDKTNAGQFFMLQSNNSSCFLRRPISIHYVDKKNKCLEFYYEVKGKGTNELSNLKASDEINVQGPLGNGFDTKYEGKNIVLIGGGMGIAPMKLLADRLKEKNSVTFIAGGRAKGYLNILNYFSSENIRILKTTDDGSDGEKGRVDNRLIELLKSEKIDIIYSCGPEKMIEKIKNIAEERGILCYLSLEARMACGVKACVGCSIKTNVGMKKVCHDGPVFESTEVIL